MFIACGIAAFVLLILFLNSFLPYYKNVVKEKDNIKLNILTYTYILPLSVFLAFSFLIISAISLIIHRSLLILIAINIILFFITVSYEPIDKNLFLFEDYMSIGTTIIDYSELTDICFKPNKKADKTFVIITYCTPKNLHIKTKQVLIDASDKRKLILSLNSLLKDFKIYSI